MSPAASDKQQQHFRGEHRAVSTSSGSITAVLYAATLPVPIVWGHVDEMSAGWWRVAHRVVLVAPVPVAPRRVGFDIGGVPEVRYKWRSEARDLSRSIWFASPLSWAIVKESDTKLVTRFPESQRTKDGRFAWLRVDHHSPCLKGGAPRGDDLSTK